MTRQRNSDQRPYALILTPINRYAVERYFVSSDMFYKFFVWPWGDCVFWTYEDDEIGNSGFVQLCRYLYYLGKIRTIQLEYTDAKECLLQAARKAPSSARGFRIQCTKWAAIVRLLLGEIPERTTFMQQGMRKALLPYFELTNVCVSIHGPEQFSSHFGWPDFPSLRMSTSNVTVGMLVIAGCAYWRSGALPCSCW